MPYVLVMTGLAVFFLLMRYFYPKPLSLQEWAIFNFHLWFAFPVTLILYGPLALSNGSFKVEIQSERLRLYLPHSVVPDTEFPIESIAKLTCSVETKWLWDFHDYTLETVDNKHESLNFYFANGRNESLEIEKLFRIISRINPKVDIVRTHSS
ncbi:MAG: hypothetical protein KDA69_16385 [Planctomycetaceae bacterium]|nr:hypothetical protein [Planctomycetaceae bacterium]MCA9045906.1 hypothetical protein [Planctomycetaceae bacterium]